MSSQPTNAANAAETASTEAEKDPFQEDLAAIMSEIDQLHNEMQTPEPAAAAAAEAAAAALAGLASTPAQATTEATAKAPATDSSRPALRAMTSADLEAPASAANHVIPTATPEALDPPEADDFMAEFRNTTGEAPLEDTNKDISPAEVPFGGPLDEEAPVAKVTEISKANSQAGDATLSMTLTGSMKLKLNYECGEQTVTISFGDDGLQLRTSDGAEFKIPTGKRTNQRKAA